MNFDSVLERIPHCQEFLTVLEMDRSTDRLRRNSSSVRVQCLGQSRYGRPIDLISIGDGPLNALLIGTPSPNEPLGCLSIEFLIEHLVSDRALLRELGFTWHFIKSIEPDGLELNEGWLKRPFDLPTYYEHVYCPELRELAAYSFPLKTPGYEYSTSAPENFCWRRAIELTRPQLMLPLHSTLHGGVHHLLSHDYGGLAGLLSLLSARHGIPQDTASELVGGMSALAPGVFELPGIKSTSMPLGGPSRQVGNSSAGYCSSLGLDTLTVMPMVPRMTKAEPVAVGAQVPIAMDFAAVSEQRDEVLRLLNAYLPALAPYAQHHEWHFVRVLNNCLSHLMSLPGLFDSLSAATLPEAELLTRQRTFQFELLRPAATLRRLARMMLSRENDAKIRGCATLALQHCNEYIHVALGGPLLATGLQPVPLRQAVALQVESALVAAMLMTNGAERLNWPGQWAELRDELKKKLVRERLKATDLYPGVRQFVWARMANELIFQYRGGLYRWRSDDKAPSALLATQRDLRVVTYTPDDTGFVYTDDSRVLRSYFKQGGVQVLNRELIIPDVQQKKYRIEQTAISEDGRWMSLLARAPVNPPSADGRAVPPPTGRQVEIMNYSERWATAKKVPREVSDDKLTEKPLAVYIRQVPASGDAPRKQHEPVFSHKGGDVWFEISQVTWARDGSRYAFATWEREKELLRVYMGTANESAKPELVLERRGEVGHEVVDVMQPRFTPDGKTLVMALDEAGWRQPYAIDVTTKALRPLLKGDFEAHEVVGFTPDSKTMFVLANRDDAAAMNLFRVDMASGAMQALGKVGEFHRSGAASEDGRFVAANAGNWAQRPELKLFSGEGKGEAKTLTDSTDKSWAAVNVMRPERFNFANRHGDRIEAYAFKPAGWKADDKRPAVVYVYGGPMNDRHIVEVDSFQNTAYLFGMYMAAKHGYVTIAVDPRGHSNYGRKFSDANWERAGEPQAEDLEDLIKLLPTELGVDASRVGLNGWSFGGFQTQYTMYTRPDLFAAGIAGAGPTEWENYNSWYSGRTIGKVDRTKPVLRKYSLLPLARGLKKPLMLVHGMQDPNVLFQDTVNVYRELLLSGKESLVELFLDPDGVHALGGAVKPAGWHRKYEAFWLRNLGRAEP